MKPVMPAPVFAQNTQDALNLLQKAETANDAIQVTPKGNIKILHQKPSQLPASKLAVVEAVLDKMQTEATALDTGMSGRNILSILSHRMPSLNAFVVSGQLGNLREEWQAVRQELDQPAQLEQQTFMQSHQSLKERLQVANEIAQLLPACINLSIEDGVASTFEHVFSNSAQGEILACTRTNINDPIDKTSGLNRQTIKDLHRQSMHFIVEQRIAPTSDNKPEPDSKENITTTKKAFEGGHQAEKIAALFEVAGQSKVAARTLSAVTNQEFFKVMGMYFDQEVPTPSGLRAITAQALDSEEELLYTLRRKPDGDIELTMLRLRSTVKLVSMDGQQEWKINSGKEFQAVLSKDNFGEKQTAKLLLKKSDLERGILNPTFEEPPTQSLRICPDYADIQQRAQRRSATPQGQWVTLNNR